MKILIIMMLFFTNAYAEINERSIPLKRLPICETWIPEGGSWGCVNLRRRDMADRSTIEALIAEIRELKARVELLEDEISAR